jgi:Cys-tRNA(Pro) deacylase
MAEIETNITRYLSSNDIYYQLLEHAKPAFTSQEAAELRNVEISEMVKSMVFLDDNREILVVVLPATQRVDLKRLKTVANINSLKFADESDIEERLGYEVGAIPPFFPKKDVPIFVDVDVLSNERVNFSSGKPEAGIELNADAFKDILDNFNTTYEQVGEIEN